MGEPPDWYYEIQAAKYLNVPVWELIKQSVWWRDKALKAMTAEVQAQEILKNKK